MQLPVCLRKNERRSIPNRKERVGELDKAVRQVCTGFNEEGNENVWVYRGLRGKSRGQAQTRVQISYQMALAVSVANLTYHHNPLSPPSLVDVNFSLPTGSRTILIGANGGLA